MFFIDRYIALALAFFLPELNFQYKINDPNEIWKEPCI